MNTWRIIWNTFYIESRRRKVAMEMWRLSSGWQRTLLLALAAVFSGALVTYFFFDTYRESSLALAVISEVFLLVALDKVKDKVFFSEYGTPDAMKAPPDNEEHRVSRYMIFRKRLRDAGITKSHVRDQFELADAKLTLEASRGEMPRKYLAFAVGLVAGMLVSWSKNFDAQELAWTVSGFVVASFFVVMILWVIPSRAERLKELKYFMLLYCREDE